MSFIIHGKPETKDKSVNEINPNEKINYIYLILKDDTMKYIFEDSRLWKNTFTDHIVSVYEHSDTL